MLKYNQFDLVLLSNPTLTWCTLLDAGLNPIATLLQKQMASIYGRGQRPRRSALQCQKIAVCPTQDRIKHPLANNTTAEVCDFKAEASWLERSHAIYAGESSTIVAQVRCILFKIVIKSVHHLCESNDLMIIVMQMQKKHTAESLLLGKDWFMVTVYPQIDYAFIDALLVIIDDINKEDGFN
ncbi:protein LURP-one-related 15-like isoform X2 [Actinidia eriantha]|uniref:protein LURP-one-related 15-like isoform X2 n=1 Tax=Actinidia eriantha TaxID=165200 RepID=UPI00258C9963|nr:protein LURP-one-related 15-like isoform X2 [Actinidia eriantha]